MTDMIWTAGYRTALINPYIPFAFREMRGFDDQTVRQALRTAGGGEAFRVRLSNYHGREALTVGAATAAAGDRRVTLTFDGAERLVIPAGAEAASDPVPVPIEAGSDMVVSLYLPQKTGLAPYSASPREIALVAAGNHITSSAFPRAEQVESRYYVSGVDVLIPGPTTVVAAFGDSWFEGVGTTIGANHRSVDYLNRRLEQGWAVNLGMSGNRLLRDGVGENALARFDHDVLSIPAVTHVLMHLGINDLLLPGVFGEPPESAGVLIDGFTALAAKAHRAGLKIITATISPFADSTADVAATRREVNDWIRTTASFDAVFDVARAIAYPDAPDRFNPALGSGDGLHLNDRGAEVMAGTINLDDLKL